MAADGISMGLGGYRLQSSRPAPGGPATAVTSKHRPDLYSLRRTKGREREPERAFCCVCGVDLKHPLP
jgi:hypothetical protein